MRRLTDLSQLMNWKTRSDADPIPSITCEQCNNCDSPPSRFCSPSRWPQPDAALTKRRPAVEVAEQWTEDNINDVSEVLVNLVMEAPVVADTFDKMPSLVADRASDMLADAFSQRVRENLVVNYTSSTRVADDIYRVAGTARLSVQVDLPVVGTRSFAASPAIYAGRQSRGAHR